MIWRLRVALAKRLVGPFVRIPERQGTWVVMRFEDGRSTATIEAERFRLKTGSRLDPRRFDDLTSYGRGYTWGRFVGTVKA